MRVKDKEGEELVCILLSLVKIPFHATAPIEKYAAPFKVNCVKCVKCLVTTPIGSGCVVLIGGFFFYSTLLHEVPADPPMGLSEYRLDQASQRSRGLLVLCNKGSGRIHRLLGQTSQAVPRDCMYKPIRSS